MISLNECKALSNRGAGVRGRGDSENPEQQPGRPLFLRGLPILYDTVLFQRSDYGVDVCTPIKPAEIVRGSMRILGRRFGRALVALVALDAFIAFTYFSVRGGWQEFRRHEVFPLAIWASVVFPVQGYSLARIGIYQGLLQANSVRAAFITIWKAGLLPFVMFIRIIVTWETAQRHFRTFPRITDQRAYAAWAGAHLLICGVFLAHASWRLLRNFRSLAAQSTMPVWWKRWLRLFRSKG